VSVGLVEMARRFRRRPLVEMRDPAGRVWQLTQNEARGLSASTVLDGHAVSLLDQLEP
jgi:YD repeat-containing protein